MKIVSARGNRKPARKGEERNRLRRNACESLLISRILEAGGIAEMI